MLKNVQEAKFRQVLTPIARSRWRTATVRRPLAAPVNGRSTPKTKTTSDAVLQVSERVDVSFDAFFTHILMHELMHGLGPHTVAGDGGETTVRQALSLARAPAGTNGPTRETYSIIEEAKADVSGLWALHFLIDKGVIDRSLERQIYTTFLASTFRGATTFDSLRHRRSARSRGGDPAQHFPRRRRRDRRRGRPVPGGPRAHPGSGRRADAPRNGG